MRYFLAIQALRTAAAAHLARTFGARRQNALQLHFDPERAALHGEQSGCTIGTGIRALAQLRRPKNNPGATIGASIKLGTLQFLSRSSPHNGVAIGKKTDMGSS